jgi:hypothetical protein
LALTCHSLKIAGILPSSFKDRRKEDRLPPLCKGRFYHGIGYLISFFLGLKNMADIIVYADMII